jgi:hypothetical protein
MRNEPKPRGGRRGAPRLPWKRGPVAWRVACNSEEILVRLEGCQSPRLSLRRAARMLGVSTQPLRDWTKRKYLKLSGPRLRYAKNELCQLVRWFAERAKPFGSENYLRRFNKCRDGRWYPFRKLAAASFRWPKKRGALTPSEIARLVGCHPSLILRAIKKGRLKARERTRCRAEISRHAWSQAFPMTLARTARLPPLPRDEHISTREVAAYLLELGVLRADQRYVRLLVHEGELEGVRPTPGRRKIFVTRVSLERFRRILGEST